MWFPEAPAVYQPPFEERPGGKRRVRLGKAVGASACVPGLFEPVALPELYPKEPIAGRYPDVTVRLVDGGVLDHRVQAVTVHAATTETVELHRAGRLVESDHLWVAEPDAPSRARVR